MGVRRVELGVCAVMRRRNPLLGERNAQVGAPNAQVGERIAQLGEPNAQVNGYLRPSDCRRWRAERGTTRVTATIAL